MSTRHVFVFLWATPMPFAILPEHVLDAIPRLSGMAVKLIAVLARHMDTEGKAWPSRRRLMAGMGTKRNATFWAAREELAKELGLTWDAHAGKKSTVYTMPKWRYGTESVPGSSTESVPAPSTQSAPQTDYVTSQQNIPSSLSMPPDAELPLIATAVTEELRARGRELERTAYENGVTIKRENSFNRTLFWKRCEEHGHTVADLWHGFNALEDALDRGQPIVNLAGYVFTSVETRRQSTPIERLAEVTQEEPPF